jgi:hypothetical protein
MAAAVASSTASATAVTIIHVAGSTAFRAATSIAIIDALCGTAPTSIGIGGGSTTGTTTVYAAYDTAGKNITSANSEIYANGYIGSVDPNPGHDVAATIIIEATWTGSLAGVTDLVAGASAASFLDETNANVIAAVNSGSLAPGTYGNATYPPQITSPGYHTTNNTVEMAMSDSLKATISKELATGTLSGTLTGTSYTGAAGLAAISTAINGNNVLDAGTSNFAGGNGDVAIVPFVWCLGASSPAYTAVTNMTQQEARALLSVGSVSQSLFTGGSTAADTNNYIYLTGRNEDSGTRIGALSESEFGVTGNPIQFQIGDGSTVYTPIQKFPANSALNTEPQISWANAGHSGYASGGNVAFALDYVDPGTSLTFASGKNSGNTGASYFTGYLGITDAKTAITGGAAQLTYNGVPFSYTAVENGSYTFWTHEHCYRLSAHNGDTYGNTIDAIADLIYACDADITYSTSTGVTHNYNNGSYTSGISCPGLFDALNVNRSETEGLPVTN